MTLLNAILYLPDLLIDSSVLFSKLRNSPYYAAYSAVRFDIKLFTYIVKGFPPYLT